MKLKGGILFYSLLVIIITSSISGLILLSSFYENRRLENSIKQDELEQNVLSAINLYLGGEDLFNGRDTTTIELFGNNSIKVFLTRGSWGNYNLLSANSSWKFKSYFREALIGSDLFTEEPIALFMPEDGRFLSISGKTELRGTCYLPGKTARVASIEGQQYIYKDIVFGEIKKSPPSIPDINKDLLNFHSRYISEGISSADSSISLEDTDSINFKNSFRNKSIIINIGGLNSLSDYSFNGNIILWSPKPVIVAGSSKLNDVILIAPKILIESGFKGVFQACAIQSIILEPGCTLGYPSQLSVIQSEGSYNVSDSLIISIGAGSNVAGAAIIKSFGLTSYIKIDKDALMTGQVYCPGNVELKGKIKGSLYCRGFYLGTERARYYNHLLNTSIDFTNLSKHFAGIDLIKVIPSKSIIKWVD